MKKYIARYADDVNDLQSYEFGTKKEALKKYGEIYRDIRGEKVKDVVDNRTGSWYRYAEVLLCTFDEDGDLEDEEIIKQSEKFYWE